MTAPPDIASLFRPEPRPLNLDKPVAAPPGPAPTGRRPARSRQRAGPAVTALRRWLAGPATGDQGPRVAPAAMVSSASLGILAAVLLGFLAQLTVFGALKHNRDQAVAYDDLRLALAEGVAPVGPAGVVPLRLGTALARVRIPDIGLKEVVLSGTTSGVLRSGVGHRRDTVLPGQAGVSILIGRRMAYGGPFSQLGELAPGAQVLVVTGQGERTYKVIGQRRAGDPGPPPLVAGGARLTLMTSDGPRFAPDEVLRVDADLEGEAAPAAAPAFQAATLPASEQAFATEPGGLGAVTGWGFLLAAAATGCAWLRARWGRWQTWLVAVPTLGFLGVGVADHAARLLPNLL